MAGTLIDPRGPRFASVITAIVLGLALLGINSSVFPVLTGIQAAVFLVGATLGVANQPYVWFFNRAIAPHLGEPKRWQDPAAPRVAQAVALLLTLVALIAWFLGGLAIAAVCVAAAWVVALTLALTGYCIGCQGYTVWKDIRS